MNWAGLDIITSGVSMGAYHAGAVHLGPRRSRPVAIALSGAYDPTQWHGWGDFGDATYFANPSAYVRPASTATTSTGCARGSTSSSSSAKVLSKCTRPSRCRLPSTSLTCWRRREFPDLDMWGFDSAHDWPWWRKQLAHHLPVSSDRTRPPRRTR